MELFRILSTRYNLFDILKFRPLAGMEETEHESSKLS